MEKMYINLVHRAENDPALMESVKFQQEECHRLGLKVTLLIGYPAMCNPEIAAYVKKEGERDDVELGISFHDISNSELKEIAGTAEPVLYLMELEARKRVIDKIFEKFRQEFGYVPASVGGYIVDAATLSYIKEKYPSVKAAITNCFEEGIKMFAGNCNGWVLFSDGGPWGASYPSRENHLMPARDREDYVGIVGLPHLNRDMVLSLVSRDDYFASHPINVMRAKACHSAESSYMYYFFDQWAEQVKKNGYGYYNVFVSAAWITKGFQTLFVDNYLDARKMYSDALLYYKENCEKGIAECTTMSEFADWYEGHVPIGAPEVNLWKEILCGTGRQCFWYVDPYYRMAFDMNQGGTIIDVRPYAHHLDNTMGPDTEVLYDGSNPFIISQEHRNTEAFCSLTYKGQRVSVKDQRTFAETGKDKNGCPTLEVEPMRFTIQGVELVLHSRFTFLEGGKIRMERCVEGLPEGESAELTEEFRGCYGKNQYPENLNGIVLHVKGAEEKELTYCYQGRALQTAVSGEGEAVAKAAIPQIRTAVSLIAESCAARAEVLEGVLFSPFYTLKMEGTVKNKEAMITCLKIEEQ